MYIIYIYIQYIYIYIQYAQLSLGDGQTTNCLIASRVKLMSFAFALTELVREARWWTTPGTASCPWGAFCFLILLAFIFGCCCGAFAVGCALSQGCQRVGLVLARLAAAYWGPQAATVGQRLAEYRREL